MLSQYVCALHPHLVPDVEVPDQTVQKRKPVLICPSSFGFPWRRSRHQINPVSRLKLQPDKTMGITSTKVKETIFH